MLSIRKFVTFDEEVLIEGFKPADNPWRMFAVAAVIHNPWAGRYVDNLKTEVMPPPTRPLLQLTHLLIHNCHPSNVPHCS